MDRLCRRSAGLVAVMLLAMAAIACAPMTRREAFAEYQTRMKARGLLRTERDPSDVRYTNEDLAEHFRRIAFFNYPNDEYREPKPLTRWEGPVRYAVFGSPGDRGAVASLMTDVARVTQLNITQVPQSEANFLIMVLDDEDQRRARRTVSDPETLAFLRDFFGAVFDCGAIAQWSDDDPVIRNALVYLHGDLEGLYRELCFHEEIAQSFGLFNDDLTVRPSIFNDDDEFALLTTHDELLLRILYDPRLKPGMDAAEAMPLVREIITEVRPGG